MILSKRDIREILRGEVGETVVRDDPPALGRVVWVRESPRVVPSCRATVVDVWPVKHGWAVLLERAVEIVPPAPPSPPRPRLALTRLQRAKLFDGECPHIGGETPCPVEAGQVVRLSSKVALRVLRVDFKQSRWALHYELRDSRDPVRLLRRTPPAHREGEGYELPADPAAQEAATREAAEESAYTSSLHGLVDEAGEAPPKAWLDVRAKTVREFAHQRRLAKQAQELREKSRAKRKRVA